MASLPSVVRLWLEMVEGNHNMMKSYISGMVTLSLLREEGCLQPLWIVLTDSPHTAVVSTLLKRAASYCSMNSLVREERSYVKETLHQNRYPERFFSPQCSPSRNDREEKDDPRSHVTIPCIKGD